MTVKELKNALMGLPADAEVYVVRDWDAVDEWGNLSDLAEVKDVQTQRVTVDEGLDFCYLPNIECKPYINE